jgi:hypothetical protein
MPSVVHARHGGRRVGGQRICAGDGGACGDNLQGQACTERDGLGGELDVVDASPRDEQGGRRVLESVSQCVGCGARGDAAKRGSDALGGFDPHDRPWAVGEVDDDTLPSWRMQVGTNRARGQRREQHQLRQMQRHRRLACLGVWLVKER